PHRRVRAVAFPAARPFDPVRQFRKDARRSLQGGRELGGHPPRGVCAMNELDIGAQDAIAMGSRLSGQRMLAARPARPGGNNRVFCLDGADGTRFALKYYPSQGIDGRDRLAQEYEALTFLARHGVSATPRPIARNTTGNCALYEWLEGEA